MAGLGTVGAALVRLLQERRVLLGDICGRQIEIAAVSARDRARERNIDLDGIEWFGDPVAMAGGAEIDVFVELMGGEGDPADAAVRAALAQGRHVVTANKALLARHGVELARLAEENGVLLNFEAAVAGGIPVIKAHARIAHRQPDHARLRHPQRHLQLYPDDDAARGHLLRGLPQGSATSRLCRGRSHIRHRRPRHGAQARHPHEPRLRNGDRRRRHLPRGHQATSRSTTSARPPISATGSSCSASRSEPSPASSSGSIRRWCRPARRSPRSTA